MCQLDVWNSSGDFIISKQLRFILMSLKLSHDVWSGEHKLFFTKKFLFCGFTLNKHAITTRVIKFWEKKSRSANQTQFDNCKILNFYNFLKATIIHSEHF